uniref:Parafibromin n=1 Tax=Plectus sambesii TaxID=2011161 RepID=A0A914WG92_9BILA
MADPLKLLREYALGRRPLKEVKQGTEQFIVFGDVAFRRDVKTNHRIYGRPNEYYTLESLLVFWNKRELVHTAYVKEAAGLTVVPVSRPDRKELLEYLKGERDHLKEVDVTAPIPVPVQIAKLTDALEGPEAKKARYDDASTSALSHKDKQQRIESLLDAQSAAGGDKASSAALRDLTKDLTAEKIAALKSKAKAHKRTTIKSTDDGFERPQEGEILMDTDQIDRDLKSRERVWLTRMSCLETTMKNFHTPICGILKGIKAREDAGNKALSEQHAPKPLTNAPDPLKNQRQQQQTGYSRYDQEKFRREETAGFQIDTGLTFRGASLKTITEGAKPLSAIGAQPAKAVQNTADVPKQQKRVSRTPIIVIPAAGTSLITMYNVCDLLQDLRFVSTEEKKAQGIRRENEVLLQRSKEGGVTVPYRVIDNPLKLTADEWDRIVAVFVQGPAWQFKGWQWGGVPTDIFARIAAFHVKYDESNLDPNVGKWSVSVLSLSRTKRHLDRAILSKFWAALDKHIIKNKPYLRF